MRMLAAAVMVTLGCGGSGADEFVWVFRFCEAQSDKCLPDLARFKSEAECLEYGEYGAHRCLHGPYLQQAAEGEAVCWKSTSLMARGECRRE